MVHFDSSISADHHINMAKSTDPCSKLKQINHFHRNKKTPNSPNQACERSRYALIDVIILIAVIFASGFLLYPYITALSHKTIELCSELFDVLIEEIIRAPVIFGCLGASILFAVMALIVIIVSTDRTCGKQGCRGLSEAAEFDIQLETEESLKNLSKNGLLKKGLFELHPDHHRELEMELKKIAPINGRAVLVFRARCGCAVGKMEVPGPRKSRKVKK